MNRSLKWIAGLFICFLTSSLAHGQIVRVGPFGGVSVRAPFVGVDVLPFRGGTRVRAPFTSVRTGAYGYGFAPYYRRPYALYADPYYVQPYYDPQPYYVEPVYGQPVVVQPVDSVAEPAYRSARMDPASGGAIADRLVASAERLRRSLEMRRDDAGIWLDYLQPQQVIDLARSGQAPASLALLLNNYEGVTGNGSLSSIWSAAGFRETYDLLRQYVGAAGTPDTNSVRPENRRSEPMEPKVAKPIEPSDDDADSKVDSETDDDQGGEVSILPPPKSL